MTPPSHAASPSISRGISSPVWRPSLLLQVLVVALIALSIIPFKDGLALMWGWWLDRPEYSHGILMPVLAAFLIWQQRGKFENEPLSGSWWGLVITAAGALLLLLGKMASVLTLIQYAYVVTLAGLMLSLVGLRAAPRLLVPLAILILMIPLPEFIFKNLTADLQLLSSKIGVAFIRLCGVSVYLEGNVIDLGSYKLEVAEACSGLRYLFPLMTLGFIMAFFYQAAWWKRALVFLSSIPVTIVMNSLRIGLVGVTVDRWGQAMAEGFLHDFEGWIIFMCSTAVMLLEVILLSKVGPNPRPWRDTFGVAWPAPVPVSTPRKHWQPTPAFLASGMLVVSLAVASLAVPERSEVVPSRNSFAEFPMRLADRAGQRSTMDAVSLQTLQLSDYVLADYRDAQGVPLNLYIAWYDSQRGGASTHSPRTCIPGNGWGITSLTTMAVPDVRIGNVPLRVNRALIENGPNKQVVYYWFQQRGRVVTNEYLVKWYMFIDSLTKRRTDGALVRLIIPITPDSSEAQADQQLQEFAAALSKQIQDYVPG